MNEHFIEGFEKEASLSHFLGRIAGGTGRAASKVLKAPSTAAVNFRRGAAGKSKVTTEQIDKARKYKKVQKQRVADKEKIYRDAEIKAQEAAKKKATEEVAKKKETRKKVMGYAKPLVAGAAVTGGSLYGLKKLDEYKQKATQEKPPMGYGYYSSGAYKQAGLMDIFKIFKSKGAQNVAKEVAEEAGKKSVLQRGVLGHNVDDLAGELLKGKPLLGNVDDLAKKIVEEGKLTHELNPEQMKKVLDKIDEVKSGVGPGTILGAAILAGAGAPIGAAMVRKTTDVGEKVLKTDIPMNPFRKKEEDSEQQHAFNPSGFRPLPKSELFR
jgi:hypothetical protein